MKRYSTTFFVYVFLASAVYAPCAQREQGTTTITGRVPSAVRLSVRQGWQPSPNQSAAGLHFSADSASVNSVQIILSGNGPSATSQVVVPLEMRTNQAYELRLTLISSEGAAPVIFASIGSVSPSGTLVAPRAVEISRDENSIDLMRCLSPVTALRGSRISVRGNFTTPTNALLTDLNLSLSPDGATPGYWRASFRISLHGSS